MFLCENTLHLDFENELLTIAFGPTKCVLLPINAK
jgi:hypothetical protein